MLGEGSGEYRNSGDDGANILVPLDVAANDESETPA